VYSTDDGHADGQTVFQCVGFTMPSFADLLMRFIEDRQIVDETGLTGSFELTLTNPTSAMHGGPAGPEDDRAYAFTRAIQSLGFHLIPKKEPIPVLIIDHLDKPTPNYHPNIVAASGFLNEIFTSYVLLSTPIGHTVESNESYRP